MAKYRRKRYAKRGRKRMRRMRRKLGRRRYKRSRRSRSVHHFKRTQTTTYTAAASSQNFWGAQYQLNVVQNYTEFTALFDMYRINKIVVKFVPRTTAASMGDNQVGENYTCVDYNDATAPLTVNEILERDTASRTRANVTHTRVFTPAVACPAYRTGISSGYVPKWKQWLDCSYVDVAHFGLKGCFDNRDNVDQIYDIYTTYYMSFRNVK